MSSRIIPVQPFDYVVFGATGDLTKRKLIPALYHRFKDGQFVLTTTKPAELVGAAAGAITDGSGAPSE